ncbi:deoxyhypusine synthase [Nematocida sp. AWRm77]|nr:deoxyhypusine synthase [Nematocida sp. AWRm77]
MPVVTGKGFSPVDLSQWVEGYATLGFQGTHMHQAIAELRRMKETKSKIFLGFTSNLISSGLRDLLCTLVKEKCVHVVVATAGGIEEDIIKTLKSSRLGSFSMDGATLRSQGLNRVGNVVIPNENYFEFEKWMVSFLDTLVDGRVAEEEEESTDPRSRPLQGYRQSGGTTIVTPSRFIHELGKKANSEESFCYWAYKNRIPVYCPGLTDGSMGDIITYYKRRTELVIDLVEDIAGVNRESVFCKRTGALVLGAGIVKHHILNANLFGNGLDHCVLINTAQEYDGSDAGARVDEAVSWGKIKKHTSSVKLHADATVVLPIILGAVWPEIFFQA